MQMPEMLNRLIVGVVCVALMISAGCAKQLGNLTLATAGDTDWPVMRLARNVEGRVCESSGLLGLVPFRDGGLLAAAVDQAVASVPDGELLTEASVELQTLEFLLVRRQCVRVVGNVGRRVRVIHLP